MSNKSVKYITKISKIENLTQQEKESLQPVEKEFVFRSNTYYNSLINWDDPSDPIHDVIRTFNNTSRKFMC
jgi:L-lysine 2,3-aminomutase